MSNSTPQDLVKATMTVQALEQAKGETLTGGQPQFSATGKNTGWNHKERDATPNFSQRAEYLIVHSQGHALPQSMVRRHRDIVDRDSHDYRGITCAEGHAVIETHKALSERGNHVAQGNFQAFERSTFDAHADTLQLPSEPKTAWGKEANAQRAARAEVLPRVKEATKNTLDDALQFSGMSSWQEYAKAESNYMAWNDIQQHGQFSSIKHAEESDISAGQNMEACEKCRADTLNHLEHHKPSL